MIVPFYKPPITLYEYIEVFKTLRDRWLTTGRKNEEFSKLISNYIGVSRENVKLISSCSAGLHLLFDAFNLKGKEILIPAITFISSVEMAIHIGAKPVIVDVDDFMTISVEDAQNKVNKHTKCIVPTYYGGNIYDIENVLDFSKTYNLIVIEDAAHGFGSEYKSVRVGNTKKFGVDATVFSFYATKNLQTGEGGAILTHNEEVMSKISKTYLHGMDKNAWKRYQENLPFYDITEVGYKYNFPDILAAIGIAQMKNFEKFQLQRESVWNFYQENLKDIQGIKLPKVREYSKHSYHLFVITLNLDMWRISRDEFILKLKEKGIGTSVHFIPVYRFSRYRELLNLDPTLFPKSEKFFKEIVSLPIYPGLRKKQLEYVVDSIKSIWNNYRR
ncbi:MAG: DegT/DnrJ/EryC1/StrS family aminotransferase [Brevinematia bacterium]